MKKSLLLLFIYISCLSIGELSAKANKSPARRSRVSISAMKAKKKPKVAPTVVIAKPESAAKEEQTETFPEEKTAPKPLKKIRTMPSATIDNIDASLSDVIEVEAKTAKLIKFNEKAGHILIADPEIADLDMVSASSLYLMGIKNGETTLRVDSKDGRTILNKTVRVTFNLNRIRNTIHEMFPNARVEVLNLDSSILLRGSVDSPKAASDIMEAVGRLAGREANVINNMVVDIPTQVLLKVKVAKVDREVTKSLGINWKSVNVNNGLSMAIFGGKEGGKLSPIVAGVATLAAATSGGVGEKVAQKAISDAAVENASSAAGNSIISGLDGTDLVVPKNGSRYTLDFKDSRGNNVGAVIDALAEENLATILAEPALVTLSGNTAKFASGGEHPYRSADTSGSTAVASTEFKEWGVLLEFTPIVISENRISIKVKPEVSSIKERGENLDPSIEKQSVETTVELGSGQSLAIAGLLKKENSATATELPGLASIPLFGSLFRSSERVLKESELVIIVTPYIVKPSSKALTNPVERMPKMYSPCKSNLHRKFNKPECPGVDLATQNSGFVVS